MATQLPGSHSREGRALVWVSGGTFWHPRSSPCHDRPWEKFPVLSGKHALIARRPGTGDQKGQL